MARVFGDSQAWAQVRARMLGVKFSARRLSDIEQLIEQGERWISAARQRAQQEHQRLEQRLLQRLRSTTVSEQAKVDAVETRGRAEIAAVEQQMRQIGQEEGWYLMPWLLWRYLKARGRKQRVLMGIRRTVGKARRVVAGQAGALKSHQQGLVKTLGAAEYRAREQFETAKQLRATGQLAGAAAELQVAEVLSGLNDQWVVIHDACLAARHFLRDRKKIPLHSAQVDHLVIGPGGVFVIETKRWSAKFAEDGSGFDPFEQVSRAGRLCWMLLKEAQMEMSVRNVIVNLGRLPERPDGVYVDVVMPERLCGYLMRFRTVLGPEAVDDVAAVLGGRTLREHAVL